MLPRAPAPSPDETVTLTVAIDVFGETVAEDFEVPAGPVRPRRLLPIVRALTETIVDRSARRAEAPISCRAGCGACCRQLVPISRTEAHAIREIVEDLPTPRRAAVEARFAEARRRLDEAGMLGRLLDPSWATDADLEPLALEYFALGIPCPFLEDGSCSIYEERPVICREYLVTSPAERCAAPTPEAIARVPLSGDLSKQIPRMEAPSRTAAWVPLIVAPAWAERHPEEQPSRTGPDLLAALLTPPSAPARGRKRKGGKRR